MAWYNRVLHYADPRTAYAAHSKVVHQVERAANTIQRAHSAEGVKRTTREIAAVYAQAEPYTTGALTFLASLFFTPAAGIVVGTGLTALSYNTGRLAAANEGKTGHEAAEAGRRQRRHVGEAAAIGLTAGVLTGVAVGAAAAAPGVAGGEGAALAAGETTGAVAVNTAEVGLSAAEAASVVPQISLATEAVAASQAPALAATSSLSFTAVGAETVGGIVVGAPAEALLAASENLVTPAVIATQAPALAASPQVALTAAGQSYAAAGASTGGFWSTVTDIGKAILPTALTRLLTPAPPKPGGVDFGGGVGAAGGAPGVGDSASADEGAFGEQLKKLPTFVKVAGAVAIALAGMAIGKKLKRKAA